MAVQKRIRGGKARWVARYRSPSGKEHSKTFDTRREATAWLAERERELRRGEWIDPNERNITLLELVEEIGSTFTRESTRNSYDFLARNLGPLADMPLRAIRRSDLEKWQAQLLSGRPWQGGKPLYQSTVNGMRGRLNNSLKIAINDGLLTHNPLAKVSRIEPERRTIAPRDIPDENWIEIFITNIKNPALLLMVKIAVATGMRASEIAGLSTTDIDPAGCSIHVSYQAHRRKGHLLPLKTPSSYRVILITPDLMGEIREWIAEHPHPSGRLFVTRTGRPMSYDAMQKAWETAVERSGLQGGFTWHSLRHYHATKLIRAGVPIKTVQARLGHASAAMTLDIYLHAIPGDDELAARVAGDLLPHAGPARDGDKRLKAI
ncbi:tyrosine-type recombinase/integrase [Corynebacterium poyangense]|uniref:Tyrosine-type recombinase/integrase n=1 Tax=Corynebacterium poyangense TaxID=2684405 RepID=A0A7H0SQD2_9CORY|nr:site-specific integrase [Corynebacterium poyangense]QNQ90757.1 tyrosine-type recombinase/integrase [Corynebacterium poyangense]